MAPTNLDNPEVSSLQEGSSTESLSRHSSVAQGPYRKAVIPNSFPYCNAVSSCDGQSETYARGLMPSGNGYPIWEMIGNENRPKKHLRQGVSIGDVGLIDREGDFVFVFNIFATPSDTVHHRLPRGFQEINPGLDTEKEIISKPDYFSPGAVLASEGVEVEVVSKDPLDIKFTSRAREGAVLVLPDGASRQDLTSSSRSRLTEYLQDNALDWYHLICNRAPAETSLISNGTLYLVTGCDKAKSWDLFAFPSEPEQAGMRLEMRYRCQESPPLEEDNDLVVTRSFSAAEGRGMTASVFVRGLRISLSNRLWANHLSHVDGSTYYNLLATPILGIRSRVVNFKERLLGPSETDIDEKEKVQFHPAIVLSQILLKKSPAADVAIVDDAVWLNLVTGHRYLTLPNIIDFLTDVMCSCNIVTHGKVVMLVSKPDVDPSISDPWPPSNKRLFTLFRKDPLDLARSAMHQEVRKIVKSPWYSLFV